MTGNLFGFWRGLEGSTINFKVLFYSTEVSSVRLKKVAKNFTTTGTTDRFGRMEVIYL